jgi:coenzyme F420 hydrogenase subunit beta
MQIFGVQPDPLLGCYLKCYLGHSANEEIRWNSTSGGLVTHILSYALEQGMIDGAIVTKMDEAHPLKPQVFIARTNRELLEAARSKYCPVPVNSVIQEILKSEESAKYAIVGLPCHIHGIRKAEQMNNRLRKRIVLHLGLFCTHTPTFLATRFLLSNYHIDEQEVLKLDYRGHGWPGDMSIWLTNEEKVVIPHFSPLYLGVTFHQFFIPHHCTVCCDKLCELADLSFGDAWLPEVVNDKQGTSLIIVRNKIGEKILQNELKVGAVTLKRVYPETVHRSQAILAVKKRRKALKNLMQSIGKPIPSTNQKLPHPRFTDYLFSISSYMLNYCFSKKTLWKFTKVISLLIGQSSLMKKLSVRGYYFDD